MLNLVNKRFWFFAISLLVIIPGIIALAVWHLNLGLDFTSGTVVDLQFSKNIDQNVVKQAFAKAGAKDLVVVTAQDTSQEKQYLYWLRFNVAIDKATETDVIAAMNTLAGSLKQGATADANGPGDFTPLVTYDGGKTYFSLLVVHFKGLDKAPDTAPTFDHIRKAVANLKDLKTSQQPTPTPTQAPTATPTTTGTPATATPTATSTPAPTATNTPAPTPTGQPTATATTAPTGSPTPAPTATATPQANRTIPVLLCDDASLKDNAQFCGDGNGIQPGANHTIITVTTSSAFDNQAIKNIEFGLQQSQKSYLLEQSKDEVGPTIASETTQRAFFAVLLSSAAILLYIWFAFRKVAKPWRYASCAIIALLHDVLVVLGMAAILGHFINFQVDSLFVTAVLTVIGFSVHDTIVVFDRIRENFQRRTSETLEQVINASLVQTMARSLNTSLTVLFTLLALTLFGGISIRSFTLTLLIGIFSGTYSSIFNASMLLVSWERGELGRLFGFKPKPPPDPRTRRTARARA